MYHTVTADNTTSTGGNPSLLNYWALQEAFLCYIRSIMQSGLLVQTETEQIIESL